MLCAEQKSEGLIPVAQSTAALQRQQVSARVSAGAVLMCCVQEIIFICGCYSEDVASKCSMRM